MVEHHLTVNFDDITNTLTTNLTVVVRHTALALAGAERGESISDQAVLPGTWFAFHTGPLNEETTKALRDSTEKWILLSALRTITMLVELALAQAWHYADLVRLNKKGPITQPLMGQHEADVRAFQDLFFFKKLKAMCKEFGDQILPALTPAIATLRNLRNVLEHQYGVASRGNLDVEWQALGLFHVSADGIETPLIPEVGKSGMLPDGGIAVDSGTIRHRLVTRRRCFPVGTTVAITRQELAEMCFTIHLWGGELTKAVLAYAQPPTTP